MKNKEYFFGLFGDTSTEPLVTELTDQSFDDLVVRSKENWFVVFYLPWCSHCKEMSKSWQEAAKLLRHKIKFGKIDAETYPRKPSQYQIKGFPRIKLYISDDKGNRRVFDYNGLREPSEFAAFAEEKINTFKLLK